MNKFTTLLPAIIIIVVAAAVTSLAITGILNGSEVELPIGGESGKCIHIGGTATCTEPAICNLCGEEYIAARGHLIETIHAVSATCTEDGLTEGEKCSRCDIVLKEQQKVAATGHKLVNAQYQAPGCTTDGHNAHVKCVRCDYTEGKTVIPARHAFVDVEALAPTCTDEGYTAHKKCSDCGETEGKETVPAQHSFGEADGNGSRVCSLCGLTEVSTSAGLKAAIEAGVENISVLAGQYTTNVKVPGGKTIKVVGAGEGTVLEGQIATTSSDAGTLTLSNMVINVNDKIVDSTGISQTSKSAIAIWGTQTVVCEDVIFNMSLSGSTAITSWWDTGIGTSIVVRDCVFNCDGQRPIRATGNVTVENTTFNDPYRYAVQLTAKASTATLMDKAIVNFKNNTIVNGANGKSFVYAIQLEGEDYGCHDLVINGSGNSIVAGEWDTANESTMYFCECCPKVDHDSIEWNVEVEAVHEGHTFGSPDANGNKVCTSCGATELSGSVNADDVKDFIGEMESGDTVIMPEGNYTLPTLADKNRVTIEGAADGSTVIGGESTSTGFGSNFGADNTYKNLTFSGTTNGVRYSYAKGGTTVFENCTFAGDSTYGFHIDQSNGATFIFNNCTFIGFNAFASDLEKVVFNNCTFLSNGNYGHTNIWSVGEFNNCTWGDNTSYGVRGSGQIYVDGAVNDQTTLNNIFADSTAGEKLEITLGEGNFIVPDIKNSEVTIKGNGDTVIATQDDGSYEGCDYSLDGCTVTFENIVINTNSETYTGYARLDATYNNCVINGTYTLYGDSVFNNCTFNISGDKYNIWTWGAPNVTFNNCTFNSDGKALLLYGTENTNLTLNGCVFNDNGALTDLKAAIEIGNDYGKSYTLTVNNTVVNGYEINDKGISTGTTLWANKNSMTPEKLTVTVDGTLVYGVEN